MVVEAFILLYEGNWARAAMILDESRDAMRAAGSRDGETVYAYFQGLVCLAAGDLAGAEAMNQVTLVAAIEGPHIPYALNAHAQAALIAILRGRPDGARSHLARCREIIAGGENFCGLFGRAALAEAMAAAAEGRHDAAEHHFTSALEISATMICRGTSRRRITCGPRRCWPPARSLARQSSSMPPRRFTSATAPARHGSTSEYRARPRQGPSRRLRKSSIRGRRPIGSETTEGIFRCEGDFWTIALGGVEMRLRSTKGLLYLAHLAARPGTSVAAEELARIGSAAARAPARRMLAPARTLPGTRAGDGDQGDQGGDPEDPLAGYLSRTQSCGQYSYWLFVRI